MKISVEVNKAEVTEPHGIAGGEIRRTVAFVKVGLHSLHDDDSIIDNGSDGEHKGKERQQVDAETYELQDTKGADDGNDNGDRRNDC